MIDQQIHHQILELEKQKVRPLNLYRFQLNHQFPLSSVEKYLDYLEKLGVDALYLSPPFRAVEKSMHGYDVINPLEINPEIGGLRALKSLSEKAKSFNMPIIIDLVANHMSTSFSNPWWFDILECGVKSLYSNYFDINWNSPQKRLKNKVLIPLLDEPYFDALAKGQITFQATQEGLFFLYFDNKLPLKPENYRDVLFQMGVDSLEPFQALEEIGDKEKYHKLFLELKAHWKTLYSETNFKEKMAKFCDELNADVSEEGRLDVLLSEQNYLLEFWQYASRGINYRRFFDINSLAALKMENQKAFDHYHALVFELLNKDIVQGIRIDHPDGFYQPFFYFKELQKSYLVSRNLNVSTLKENDFNGFKPLYLILEKILEKDEKIPSKWQTDGTVGYEYLNYFTHLFVDSSFEASFDKLYKMFQGDIKSSKDLLQEEKRSFTFEYMQSEVEALCEKLQKVFLDNSITFGIEEIKASVIELFASIPVYRTYLEENSISMSSDDKAVLYEAFDRAVDVKPNLKRILDELRNLFFKTAKRSVLEDEFIMRFQQLCPSIMAKGFEDTHLYNYNRFLAFNEVGGFVDQFGISTQEFHEKMLIKQKNSPYSWITSSTHDTKRSEGFRLRLAALSEMYDSFEKLCILWKERSKKYKVDLNSMLSPDENMEYFIYQTLVGFWPSFALSEEEKSAYAKRVKEYVLKAVKEAKKYTNWVNHNTAYEKPMESFIHKLLFLDKDFYEELTSFVQQLAPLGFNNVLSASVIKIGLPAALDIYQGTEYVDFALVDPDNRRFVDFEKRIISLNEMTFEKHYQDHHLEKQRILSLGLHFRKKFSDVIFSGSYIPLKILGDDLGICVCYAREFSEKKLIVLAFRHTSKLTSDLKNQLKIQLPESLQKKTYHNLLSQEVVEVESSIEVAKLCNDTHYAVLFC